MTRYSSLPSWEECSAGNSPDARRSRALWQNPHTAPLSGPSENVKELPKQGSFSFIYLLNTYGGTIITRQNFFSVINIKRSDIILLFSKGGGRTTVDFHGYGIMKWVYLTGHALSPRSKPWNVGSIVSLNLCERNRVMDSREKKILDPKFPGNFEQHFKTELQRKF